MDGFILTQVAQYIAPVANLAIVVLVAINIKQSRYLISHHIDIKRIKDRLNMKD